MNSADRLRAWAKQNGDRGFEIVYTTCRVRFPWGVNLENHATMATVHVDSFETLSRAVDSALAEAEKEPAL